MDTAFSRAAPLVPRINQCKRLADHLASRFFSGKRTQKDNEPDVMMAKEKSVHSVTVGDGENKSVASFRNYVRAVLRSSKYLESHSVR